MQITKAMVNKPVESTMVAIHPEFPAPSWAVSRIQLLYVNL